MEGLKKIFSSVGANAGLDETTVTEEKAKKLAEYLNDWHLYSFLSSCGMFDPVSFRHRLFFFFLLFFLRGHQRKRAPLRMHNSHIGNQFLTSLLLFFFFISFFFIPIIRPLSILSYSKQSFLSFVLAAAAAAAAITERMQAPRPSLGQPNHRRFQKRLTCSQRVTLMWILENVDDDYGVVCWGGEM